MRTLEKRVFVWMGNQMRRTQFIQWARDNNLGNFSHPTIRRAMERQYTGVKLTARQRGMEEAALEFMNTIVNVEEKAAHAA